MSLGFHVHIVPAASDGEAARSIAVRHGRVSVSLASSPAQHLLRYRWAR